MENTERTKESMLRMRIRRASLHNKGTFLSPLNIFLAPSLIITMKKNSGIQEQDKTCRRNFFFNVNKKARNCSIRPSFSTQLTDRMKRVVAKKYCCMCLACHAYYYRLLQTSDTSFDQTSSPSESPPQKQSVDSENNTVFSLE